MVSGRCLIEGTNSKLKLSLKNLSEWRLELELRRAFAEHPVDIASCGERSRLANKVRACCLAGQSTLAYSAVQWMPTSVVINPICPFNHEVHPSNGWKSSSYFTENQRCRTWGSRPGGYEHFRPFGESQLTFRMNISPPFFPASCWFRGWHIFRP
jgi:hypothetical protein